MKMIYSPYPFASFYFIFFLHRVLPLHIGFSGVGCPRAIQAIRTLCIYCLYRVYADVGEAFIPRCLWILFYRFFPSFIFHLPFYYSTINGGPYDILQYFTIFYYILLYFIMFHRAPHISLPTGIPYLATTPSAETRSSRARGKFTHCGSIYGTGNPYYRVV